MPEFIALEEPERQVRVPEVDRQQHVVSLPAQDQKALVFTMWRGHRRSESSRGDAQAAALLAGRPDHPVAGSGKPPPPPTGRSRARLPTGKTVGGGGRRHHPSRVLAGPLPAPPGARRARAAEPERRRLLARRVGRLQFWQRSIWGF